MSAPDTALIVIDVQESFRHRPYFDELQVAAFQQQLQVLIDGARQRGIPIVQVFHVEPDGPFSLASGHVRALEPLRIEPDLRVYKQRHSALIGNELPVWLTERGIRRLLISGIRTEQCCETTTRHASDLGYSVDFVTAATLSFAMSDRHGRLWSADEIKARTELVLEHRFARIVSVAEALADFPLRDCGSASKSPALAAA